MHTEYLLLLKSYFHQPDIGCKSGGCCNCVLLGVYSKIYSKIYLDSTWIVCVKLLVAQIWSFWWKTIIFTVMTVFVNTECHTVSTHMYWSSVELDRWRPQLEVYCRDVKYLITCSFITAVLAWCPEWKNEIIIYSLSVPCLYPPLHIAGVAKEF
jgi:hypothetical protein